MFLQIDIRILTLHSHYTIIRKVQYSRQTIASFHHFRCIARNRSFERIVLGNTSFFSPHRDRSNIRCRMDSEELSSHLSYRRLNRQVHLMIALRSDVKVPLFTIVKDHLVCRYTILVRCRCFLPERSLTICNNSSAQSRTQSIPFTIVMAPATRLHTEEAQHREFTIPRIHIIWSGIINIITRPMIDPHIRRISCYLHSILITFWERTV